MKILIVLCIPMLIVAIAVQSSAHHSLIGYDQSKTVTIRGKVSSIEWMNPHAALEITVENRGGVRTKMVIDMAAPRGLLQRGIDKSFVKVGDSVTADVWLLKVPAAGAARDSASGRILTLADGRTFDISDNWATMVPVR
jgi:hypothetical protein